MSNAERGRRMNRTAAGRIAMAVNDTRSSRGLPWAT
jgi:hypothetical protein